MSRPESRSPRRELSFSTRQRVMTKGKCTRAHPKAALSAPPAASGSGGLPTSGDRARRQLLRAEPDRLVDFPVEDRRRIYHRAAAGTARPIGVELLAAALEREVLAEDLCIERVIERLLAQDAEAALGPVARELRRRLSMWHQGERGPGVGRATAPRPARPSGRGASRSRAIPTPSRRGRHGRSAEAPASAAREPA